MSWGEGGGGEGRKEGRKERGEGKGVPTRIVGQCLT